MTTERVSQVPLNRAMVGLLATTLFYTFPRAMATSASTAAPWSILVTGLLVFLLYLPVLAMLNRQPGTNIVDLARAAGGRGLAIAFVLIVISYLLAASGTTLRQSSELVVTALYPHTPQTFAMTSMALTAAIAASMSPDGLIWIEMLFAVFQVGSILIVLVGNLGWGQLRNLLPLSGHGLLPVAANLLPQTSHFYPFLAFLVFTRHVTPPRRLVAGAAWILGLSSILYALVIMLYLMVYPLPGGLEVPFPLFEMTRLVQGGRYFERIDAIWVIFWTFGSALRLATTLMAGALLFKDAFRLPHHRVAVLPLTCAVISWALVPSNQAGALDFETYILRVWGFLFAPVLPLAIALLALLRQRRARKQAGGTQHA